MTGAHVASTWRMIRQPLKGLAVAKTAFAPDRERARHRELRLHPKGIGQHVSGRQGAAAARAGPDAARLGSRGLQRPPRTPGALLRAQGHGTARPIHHPQPLLGRKDVGERAGHGFGIRIDPLPLRHGNKKIGRNFEVFTPWDFIAAITQHIADKSFQLVRYYGWYSKQDAQPAGQAGGRRSADRGRRHGGERRFCPRAAPHPF